MIIPFPQATPTLVLGEIAQSLNRDELLFFYSALVVRMAQELEDRTVFECLAFAKEFADMCGGEDAN